MNADINAIRAQARRQGRVDGQRDIETACARSYRLGALEGGIRALLALGLLVGAACWLGRRG